MPKKVTPVVKDVAAERLLILYKLAIEVLPSDEKLSKEYIRTLVRISEHYKIKIDPKLKVGICKTCMLPLIPGKNAEIRVIAKERRKIYRCRRCGRTNSLSF